MTTADEFERLRENQRQADDHLPTPPRLKPLAEVLAPVEAIYRDKWSKDAALKAEREATPDGQRAAEAREIFRARFPKMLDAPTKALAARCKPAALEPLDRWTFSMGSVLICGPTRIGKTTAAGVLCRRLFTTGIRLGGAEWERVQRIVWAHASDIGNARKRHPLGESEAPEIERASFASLLVLDDLGWDIEPAPICDVLNKRYERGAPTIITSGIESSRLFERYGEAVMRRIFDAGGQKKGCIVDLFEKKDDKRKPRERA